MKGSVRQRGKGDTWEITVYLGRDSSTGRMVRLYETVRGKRKLKPDLQN